MREGKCEWTSERTPSRPCLGSDCPLSNCFPSCLHIKIHQTCMSSFDTQKKPNDPHSSLLLFSWVTILTPILLPRKSVPCEKKPLSVVGSANTAGVCNMHSTQNTLTQLYLHCGEVYVENKHKPKLSLHQSVRQQRIQNFNRAHCPVSLRYLRCIDPQERMPSYLGTWTTSTSPRQMWPSLKAPGPYLRNMSPG